MAAPTLWERVRGGSKKSFDAVYRQVDKLGAPVNRLSNKLGSEAFWPTTLDKESDKAARILKSFCKDGFYAEDEQKSPDGPKGTAKVVKKIPAEVIKNAKGLAIFTTMRTGLWLSGAGGSGILIARLPDGSWSPPSGIMLHTAGLGFLVGVDIYDCIVVINSEKALDAFSKVRCTLGSEVSVAAGPYGAGGVIDSEVHKRQAPIFTYLKSRGFYAGVQIDGTIIIERNDENEKFYGERISVADILAGKARHPPAEELRRLTETIKAAQGDSNFDESALPNEPPPGDYLVEEDGRMFGVPEKDDPDPYGVLALEKEGMSLKEAGTHKRASWQEFHFNPSPTSPIHTMFSSRVSTERNRHSGSRRNSWRASALSGEAKTPSSMRTSMEFPRASSSMVDSATQTDTSLDVPSPGASIHSGGSGRSSRGSFNNIQPAYMERLPEDEVLDISPTQEQQRTTNQVHGYNTPPGTPPLSEKKVGPDVEDIPAIAHVENTHVEDVDEDSEDEDDEYDDAEEDVQIIEQPVLQSVQTVKPAMPSSVNKAKVVTVGKRPPPPQLPARNPNRNTRNLSPHKDVIASASASTSPERKETKHEDTETKEEYEEMGNPWAETEEPHKGGAASTAA